MSYDGEKIDALRIELRKFETLSKELHALNENFYVFDRLAAAIERQNELKEQELGIQRTKKLHK